MTKSILTPVFVLPTEVKSFRDYFRLKAPADRIARALGYEFAPGALVLPRVPDAPLWAGELGEFLGQVRAKLSINVESTRRELLIAPNLANVAIRENVRVDFEYPIEVNAWLRGSLDYLVQGEVNLLVVEAKLGDPAKGVKQLIAQLAALDAWTPKDAAFVWAALTLGETWQFLRLERETRQITLDSHTFAVPDDLCDLVRVILGIAKNGTAGDTAI